jgi:hypothetical protein
MAYDFNGTSQVLQASAPAVSVPLTFACWFNTSQGTSATAKVLVQISNPTSATNNFWRLAIGGGGTNIVAITGQNGVNGRSDTTAITLNAWNHAAAVFSSSTSRVPYLNAVAGTVLNTSNLTPVSPSVYTSGASAVNNIYNTFYGGLIAEVGIWNVALTQPEIASLAKGMTCNKVRPQSLVFYAPLIRNLQDVRGGLTITNNNGATVANHPRVYA